MENWESKVAKKALRVERLNKSALGNTRQDMTRPILEDLLGDGYSVVTWDSGRSRHSVCVNLDKQTWSLENFLSGLEHDAPLFEKSHPGDISCTLIVSGDGLPDMRVDSYGHVNEEIGSTPRPVTKKKPKTPSKTKTLRREKTKVEQVPMKPTKKKYVYVPKEVYKKLVQTPVQPDLKDREDITDEEWEEMQNFNKETSKRIPNWIKGIVKEQ